MNDVGPGPLVAVCDIPLEVPEGVEDLTAALTIDERERLRTFEHPERRFQFVASRLLSRAVEEGGRPFASIAHCRGHVAVAISRAAIGIDIEVEGRYADAIARRVLGAGVADVLATMPAPECDGAFTSMWAVTEACGKAAGRGLQPPRVTITLPFTGRGRWGDLRWTVLQAPEGTALAAAWVGPGEPSVALRTTWSELLTNGRLG